MFNIYLCCRHRLGDGAKEITKAGVEVFGAEGTRLMCWPHTYRNLVPRMSAIKKINKKLQEGLLADIESLLWSYHNEETFGLVFDLLESKYTVDTNHSSQEKIALREFFSYFREQWGPASPVFRWYEGAHPWRVSNNQGIEGTNKYIKKEHTFKRRCPLGTFMDIVDRMVG